MMIGIKVNLPDYLRKRIEFIAKSEKKSISKAIREIVGKKMREKVLSAP